MSVEIAEDGAVVAAGQTVNYATAYDWAVDNPEKITVLVQDTKAFVTVIAEAEAEAAPAEQQQVAVREAFTAGRPQQPGASWSS
ncbi:hypothetical protein ACFYE2_09360 [Kocuria sp. CPCC 205300]|uniref:hypothetical protein n=1 Tax=Kocuria sabuli TaxID=3071448 RepID=UPI0036D8C069